MQSLALLFALALASLLPVAEPAVPHADVDHPPLDPCELGERIARLGPCLERKDCESFDLWNRYYGPPSVAVVLPNEGGESRRDRDDRVGRTPSPFKTCPAPAAHLRGENR